MSATLTPLVPAIPSTAPDTPATLAEGTNVQAVRDFLSGDDDAQRHMDPTSWGPIGEVVFDRTYSRALGETSETWAETARRVALGNLAYSPRITWLDDEAVELFGLIHGMKLLPAGRHLRTVGTGFPYSRNCLAGETMVVTRQGLTRIEDLAGSTSEVIDGNGGWVEVPFKSYGEQALLKITLRRFFGVEKTIHATADHGWFAKENRSSTDEPTRVVTGDLQPGSALVTVGVGGERGASWEVASVDRTDRVEEVYCCEVPTTQSFVLDDDILTSNCFAVDFTDGVAEHVRFLSSRLFEGGGVGSNYSHDLLAYTKPVTSNIDLVVLDPVGHDDRDGVVESAGRVYDEPREHDEIVVADDTRKGWVAVWVHLVNRALAGGNHRLAIDVSNVRPYGSPLRSFGGTASGPEPLVASIIEVVRVLNGACGRVLGGLEAMDIDHALAASIVAGGTRRSARLAMMHWQDPDIFDFIACKADQSKHWSANISVEVDDDFHAAVAAGDSHANAVLDAAVAGMALNGEPGFINTDRHSIGEPVPIRNVNPCVTGDLLVQTTDGLRRVDELVGTGQIELLVNDEVWSTTSEGFFKTANKGVLELNIDGTPLRVTADHLVMTPAGWRPAGELSIGDVVTLTDSAGNTWPGQGTEAEGYLLGHLVGDGCLYEADGKIIARLSAWDQDGDGHASRRLVLNSIEAAGLTHRSDWKGWRKASNEGKWDLHSAAVRDLAETFGITLGNKTVTEEVMAASSDFQTGFLRGLFDTDGHVEGESSGSGVTVRLTQSDDIMLGKVRTMLLAQGIRSVVRSSHPAGNRGLAGDYETRASFRLIVSGSHVETYDKVVGFGHFSKSTLLSERQSAMVRGFYAKPMVGTITNIVEQDSEDVYDCQVPGLNAFVANGTVVHNCAEISLLSGESCNIGSVNLAAFVGDAVGARRAFRLLARFLYRATLDTYPDPVAADIENVNRRIGAGFMGLQHWTVGHGTRLSDLPDDPHLLSELDSFRREVRLAADDIADTLDTPRSVKVTAIAPNGTISQLPGVTPGIHPVHARYFIRRVRFSDSDPALVNLAAQGYRIVVDPDAKSTMVVEMPVRDSLVDEYGPALVEQADELGLEKFGRVLATVEEVFTSGTDGNAISATASIPGIDAACDDVDAAVRASATVLRPQVLELLGRVKGLTVFPEVSRDLAPYEAITHERYLDEVAKLDAATDTVGDANDGECKGACPIW